MVETKGWGNGVLSTSFEKSCIMLHRSVLT